VNYELKTALLRAGVPQYEIARRAGLDETALSRIVRGRRVPSADERGRLAAVLGVPESLLFGSQPEGKVER